MNKREFDSGLPDELARWCVNLAGAPFTVLADCSHAHNLSSVWRLRDVNGETRYLKRHGSAGKWGQECHAYERWTRPAFSEAAPRLLACSENGPQAILISALPGAAMERADLTRAQKRAGWQAAGAALARLHALETGTWLGGLHRDGSPAGETWTDPVAYVQAKIEGWVERGLRDQTLHPDEAVFVRAAASDWTEALRGEPFVPAHRDYTTRNWIVSPDGRWIGAMDFERCCWDVRAGDMSRPWSREFLHDPGCADAFFDGYRGGPPDARLRAQILATRLLHAASSVVWAAGVNDAAFIDEARAELHRLRAGNKKDGQQ